MKLLSLVSLCVICGCSYIPKSACPKPYTFSSEQQKKAAEELNMLPDDSALVDMFIKENRNNDYLRGMK